MIAKKMSTSRDESNICDFLEYFCLILTGEASDSITMFSSACINREYETELVFVPSFGAGINSLAFASFTKEIDMMLCMYQVSSYLEA